jgi:hypothetical protein
MGKKTVLATLIGDVVGSRRHRDQRKLLSQLVEALAWVNKVVPALQPLAPSIGDEFQGAYASLDSALLASLLLQLHTKGFLELRFGLGWGDIAVLDPKTVPAGQSGTAWWAAREAIDHVAHPGTKGWPEGMRSWFIGGADSLRGPLNAYLLCRDQVLWRMDRKDARITIGLFLGENQVDMVRELGIEQSTISQRQRRRGPSALYRAHMALRTGLAGAAP